MCDHDGRGHGVASLSDGRLIMRIVCEGCGTEIAYHGHEEYQTRPNWSTEQGEPRGDHN